MSSNGPVVNTSLSQFAGFPVLYPNTTIQAVQLDPSEVRSLKFWFDSRVKHYQAIDPYLAMNFAENYSFFLSVAQIAKGKFQQVSSLPPSEGQGDSTLRSPQIPAANQIGIQDILPEDIYRNQAGTGVTTGPHTWDINALTAQTAVYMLGDSVPTYFSTNGTEPNRYVLGVMRNGLVEIGGNTPVFDQFFYKTTLNGYNPFTVNEAYNVTEVANKTIYTYDTPGAILLDEVVKAQLTAMPKYGGVNSRVAMIGIKVYEYNQYTALV